MKKSHKEAIIFQDTVNSLTTNSTNYNYTPKVEDIILGSYVKKDRLTQLVYDTFSGTSISDATELNIFVDLNSVLHQIFSSSYRTKIESNTVITTMIINLCAHYRSFFRPLSVNTKFYLIYSNNTCDINEKFVYKYNFMFKEKSEIPMFKSIIEQNFGLLKILCPYLPDIFFINSPRNYEVSVIIAHIIKKNNDNIPNLVITRDLYPLQLCTLFPYTSILVPYKYRGRDNSIIVPLTEKNTHRKIFWDLVCSKRKVKADKLYDISPINFNLFSALNRMPERYMLPIVSTEQARKIIYHFVGSEDIKIPIQQLYNDSSVFQSIPVSIVEGRFKALDVEYMLPYYDADIESKELNFQNLYDDGTIQMINSKYFANEPIDLQNL